MISDDLRFKLEENAVAVLLTFAGLCIGLGIFIQETGKAIDAATGAGKR